MVQYHRQYATAIRQSSLAQISQLFPIFIKSRHDQCMWLFHSILSVLASNKRFSVFLLIKMNMGDMLTNQADLSGLLSSCENLKVSEVHHSTSVRIDEEASEIASATSKRYFSE